MDDFYWLVLAPALCGGTLIALVSAWVGVFVVQRGLSFVGAGLAHAAFGGVALGVLWGIEPLYVALPFTMLVASLVVFIRNRTGLQSDTAIGILFTSAMALGMIVFPQDNAAGPMSYLFGDILLVRWFDCIAAAVLVFVALGSMRLWSSWAYATFDKDQAKADGLPVTRHDMYLILFIAATVVVSIKLVGIVLTSALLIIPPATARLCTRTFSGMTVVALFISGITVPAGLMLSALYSWPSGASIIAIQALVFTGAALLKRS